jgi:uncharacterized protein (TIGR00251 family)
VEGLLHEVRGRVYLTVHVVPRASRTEIVGLHGHALRVRLNAPPVGGAANAALLELLTGSMGLRQDQIELVAGHTSRRKTVAIAGLPLQAARDWLDRVTSGAQD